VSQIIEAGVNIRAPAGDVWRIITDTEIWPEWGPSVRNVRSRDRFIQYGSTGYVQTAFGLWVPFEISDYIVEKKWSWRIYRMKTTGHRIKRIAHDKCRLIFDMPLFMAPYWFICAIAVRKIRHLAENRFKF
jgi:polyketide cyclase/dehydrase/lipid transport protein